MNQMLIYLAIGLAVILAGIGGFSAIGKKEKKDLPDLSQRELVYSCGDEALIQFYEAAATDEEREQIAGFAAELIARNQGRKQAPGEEDSDLDNVDMEALRAEMEALGSMTGQIVMSEEEALELTGAAAGLGLIAAGVAAAGHKDEAEAAEEAEPAAEEEAVEPAPDLDGLGLMFAGVAAAFTEHKDEEAAAEASDAADAPEIEEEPEAEAGPEIEEETAPEADDLSLADANAGCEEAEPEPASDLDGLGLMLAGVAAENPADAGILAASVSGEENLAEEAAVEAETIEEAVEEAAEEVVEEIEEAAEEIEEAAAEAVETVEETAEEAVKEVAEEAVEEAAETIEEVEETVEEDDELIRAQIAFAEAQTEEPPLKKGPSPEERADLFTKQADAAIAAILGGASVDSLLHLSDDKADTEEDLPFGVEAPAAEPAPAAEDVQVEPAVEGRIAEEAPVEEAPIEEAPVEEAVEETPIEEAPVEEAVEEAPAEEASIEKSPIEESPIEEAAIEEAPVEEEAPAETTGDLSARIAAEVAALQAKAAEEATVGPADADPTAGAAFSEEAAVEEAPIEEAPVEEVPVEETPIEEAPVEEVPVEETPIEEAPVEEAPAANSGELPFDFFGKRDYSGKDGLGVVQEACITTAKAGPAADHAAIAALKAQADGKVQEPSLMVCPYCGSVVDVGSHFCIICGSALDETGAAMAAAVASQAPVQSVDGLVEPDFESRLEDESLAADEVDFGAAPEVRIQPAVAEENPLELTAAEIAKKEYTQQVATLAEDFAAKRSTTDFWQLDMAQEAAADHRAGVKFSNQYSSQLPEILAAAAAAEAAEAPPIFSEDVVFAEPEPERDPLEETMVFSPTDDIMASVRELEKRIMADLDLDIKDLPKK